MGTKIINNDTLQLTPEQGFPVELDLEHHLKSPYSADIFAGKSFSFQNKSGIRQYQAPPVRNFLVENKNGKWIYWGLIQITEINHDYVKNTTAGKYIITYIYTPEEMRKAHELIDRNEETRFFD
jgi:hypothetical protein